MAGWVCRAMTTACTCQDDLDRNESVDPPLVRLEHADCEWREIMSLARVQKADFQVGDLVEQNWDDAWYEAMIFACSDDGTYEVRWCEDSTYSDVLAKDLRHEIVDNSDGAQTPPSHGSTFHTPSTAASPASPSFNPPPVLEAPEQPDVPVEGRDYDIEMIESLEECKQPMAVKDGGVNFTVTIDKRTSSKRLGLVTKTFPRDPVLRIERIKEGGLLEDWNIRNPKHSVREGDLIIQVNTSRGDGTNKEVLYNAIASGTVLRLVINRRVGIENLCHS